ncbi:MAG: cupin domain-containing protein [Candidatus Saccharimonadales bacterium]
MKGYYTDLEKATRDNTCFRHVVYTGAYSQLVLMHLEPREAIGLETHGNDQFFRIEQGHGTAIVDGHEYKLHDGSSVIVPAGAKHNIINTSTSKPMKLYTIYSPPHHKDGVKFKTKAAAGASDEEYDGMTTEQVGKG